MNKYVYRDKSSEPCRIIFECEASTILEADALYRLSIGRDPSKEKYVACEVVTARSSTS